MSGYAGRGFTIYLEPMAAPGQVNSRNYLQDNYYVVVSPAESNLHMDAIRHTYLHFVLDPLVAKRATSLDRLRPVLAAVQKAPMAEDYKLDPGLLVIECLIRAIEARTPADPKLPEKDRLAMVQRDEAEGFVLTAYFYDELKQFEKGDSGLQGAFPDWLHNIDVDQRRSWPVRSQYAPQADARGDAGGQSWRSKKVDLAERELASGNPAGAEKLAQEALQSKEDPAPRVLRAGPCGDAGRERAGGAGKFSESVGCARIPA